MHTYKFHIIKLRRVNKHRDELQHKTHISRYYGIIFHSYCRNQTSGLQFVFLKVLYNYAKE
jgi:hypothetical protein